MRVVHWEWLGLGLPHQDLAALLKQTPPLLEERAIAAYAERDGSRTAEEHRELYRWCKLERALLDASFLAIQAMQGGRQGRSRLRAPIRRAMGWAFAAFRQLSGGPAASAVHGFGSTQASASRPEVGAQPSSRTSTSVSPAASGPGALHERGK
jgi:hypothetical protein